MDGEYEDDTQRTVTFGDETKTISVEVKRLSFSVETILKETPTTLDQAPSILNELTGIMYDISWFTRSSIHLRGNPALLIEQEANKTKSVMKEMKGKRGCKVGPSSSLALAARSAASPIDLFTAMLEMPEYNFLTAFYFAYFDNKSAPCMVHDRPILEYAKTLCSKAERDIARIVYTEMKSNGFLNASQLTMLLNFQKECEDIYDSMLIQGRGGHGVSQDKCRRTALAMIPIFMRQVHLVTGGRVRVSEAVIVKKMSYVNYKDVKSGESDEIDCILGSDTEPRVFDATTPFGKCYLDCEGTVASKDAARSAYDQSKHIVHAFENTSVKKMVHTSLGVLPSVECVFTVLHNKHRNHTPCLPLQFGYRTAVFVYNPFIEADIERLNASNRNQSSTPYVCNYMPWVTLLHINPDITFWNNCIASFIARRDNVFNKSGEKQHMTNCHVKIVHQNIVWIMISIKLGIVSLNDTLDRMSGHCPSVLDAKRGECKSSASRSRSVLLCDDVVGKAKSIELACKHLLGFNDGNTDKETGDVGKPRALHYTQICLRKMQTELAHAHLKCSFFSIDYLAALAVSAFGLSWVVLVNAEVEIWGDRSNVRINPSEVLRIQAFQQELLSCFEDGQDKKPENSFNYFNNRIAFGLLYMANEFIKNILLLLHPRNPEDVALEFILILCGALKAITTSVEIQGDNIIIEIDRGLCCDENTFLRLITVPFDPNSNPDIFSYDSFIEKLIQWPQHVLKSLNRYSANEFSFDYLTLENQHATTADLKIIYDKHKIKDSSRRLVLNEGQLKSTFERVDVLFLAKARRLYTTKKQNDDMFNDWLRRLFSDKLKNFVDVNCDSRFVHMLFGMSARFQKCLGENFNVTALPEFKPLSLDLDEMQQEPDTDIIVDPVDAIDSLISGVEDATCAYHDSQSRFPDVHGMPISDPDAGGGGGGGFGGLRPGDGAFWPGAAGGGGSVQYYPQGGIGSAVYPFGGVQGSNGVGFSSAASASGGFDMQSAAGGGGSVQYYPQGGIGSAVSPFGEVQGSNGVVSSSAASASGGFGMLSAAEGRTTVGVPDDDDDAEMNHVDFTPTPSGNESLKLRNRKGAGAGIKKPPRPGRGVNIDVEWKQQPRPENSGQVQEQTPGQGIPTRGTGQGQTQEQTPGQGRPGLRTGQVEGQPPGQGRTRRGTGQGQTQEQTPGQGRPGLRTGQGRPGLRTGQVQGQPPGQGRTRRGTGLNGGSRKKNKHNITKKYRTKTRKSRQTRHNKHKYKHIRTIKRRKSRRNNSN